MKMANVLNINDLANGWRNIYIRRGPEAAVAYGGSAGYPAQLSSMSADQYRRLAAINLAS